MSDTVTKQTHVYCAWGAHSSHGVDEYTLLSVHLSGENAERAAHAAAAEFQWTEAGYMHCSPAAEGDTLWAVWGANTSMGIDEFTLLALVGTEAAAALTADGYTDEYRHVSYDLRTVQA